MTPQLQRLMLKLLPRPMGEGALGSSHPVLSSSSTAQKQATRVAPLSRGTGVGVEHFLCVLTHFSDRHPAFESLALSSLSLYFSVV